MFIPQRIIFEKGASNGYPIGFIIAPVFMYPNWHKRIHGGKEQNPYRRSFVEKDSFIWYN